MDNQDKPIFILNLECSAYQSSVAISKNKNSITLAQSEDNTLSSQRMTIYIESCLKDAGLQMKDLDAVAISAGPGSYTGLRVASSTAKGICFALDIPLISLDTLDIIAQSLDAKDFDIIIPLIDARRDEVYYKVLDGAGGLIEDTSFKVLDAHSFDAFNGRKVLICGNGAQKAAEIMQSGYTFKPSLAMADAMGALSYAKFRAKSFEDVAYFSPNYLKPPNITQSKKPLF